MLVQIVEVVDHQAERLLEALARHVAERVEPLQPRTVVEVEARHRVALGCGRLVRQVGGGKAQQCGLLFFVQGAQRVGVGQRAQAAAAGFEQRRLRGLEPLERPALQAGQMREVRVLAEPRGEAGDRRQGAEGLQLRQLALELLGHALDQEVAERNPAQPRLAVADRVERRDLGAARVGRLGLLVDQRRDRARACPAAAPPRRRSAARRAAADGRTRSSAGRAAAVGADRPSRRFRAPPRGG